MKFNKRLLLYIMIVLLKQLFSFYLSSNIVSYFFLLALIFLIITEKKENYLAVILFLHPCSALFDDISFPYIFNISIFIFTIKVFFIMYKNKDYNKPNKKLFLMVLLLLLYEIFLNVLYGFFSAKLFSLLTWASSYLFAITYTNIVEKPNLTNSLKYFYYGFLTGAIGGLTIPLLQYGFNFPSRYRYMGLFRDPNVYSLDALLIIFSYLKLYKTISIPVIVTVVLGFFSVSKMFILVLIVGIFINFIFNIKYYNPKSIIKFIILIAIFCFIGFHFSIFDTIYSKYVDRIDTENFSTGRTNIILYYSNRLVEKPVNLFIGSSNSNYRFVLANDNYAYSLYESHNTYLELLLSWGIAGTIYYISFLIIFIKYLKNKYNIKKIGFNNIPLLIVFLLAVFSLAYLSADIFIILIFYLILNALLFSNLGGKTI